uniref:non-specific serine/threonine protein kinase n=1 Tax=Pelusios castaneus TaxID=367368 RepID=A0A8C8SXP4_9SAUR
MDDAAVLKKRGYVLGINLGEGSYAKVKSAYSDRLKFNVAVKIINKKKAPRDFLDRFLPREIEILARVNHCSIVKTYEIFETSDGKVYIVMELGVQGDLLEFIKSRGAISEDVARKMFRQLSSAIKYCHDLDVVHRDLKCENLLLDKDFNIKLSDFGFSRRLAHDENGKLVLSKTFCGSAAYAAPEVLQGIPYEPKIYDIWSLGVILFIMVCGSMPYDDSNIGKMLKIQKEHRVHFPRAKNLTVECKDLIYRMLQPDVCRRFSGMAQFTAVVGGNLVGTSGASLFSHLFVYWWLSSSSLYHQEILILKFQCSLAKNRSHFKQVTLEFLFRVKNSRLSGLTEQQQK